MTFGGHIICARALRGRKETIWVKQYDRQKLCYFHYINQYIMSLDFRSSFWP